MMTFTETSGALRGMIFTFQVGLLDVCSQVILRTAYERGKVDAKDFEMQTLHDLGVLRNGNMIEVYQAQRWYVAITPADARLARLCPPLPREDRAPSITPFSLHSERGHAAAPYLRQMYHHLSHYEQLARQVERPSAHLDLEARVMNEANRREWDVSDDKKYTQERYGHLVNASVKVAEWLAAMGRPVQPKRTVTVSGKELGKALAILRKRTPSQKALKDFGQQNNPLFKALHLTAFHGFLHLEVYGLDKDGKAEVVRECVRIDGWWDKSPEWETFVAASGLLDSARFLDGFDITLELWQPYSVYLTVTAHVLDKVVNMQRVPLLNV